MAVHDVTQPTWGHNVEILEWSPTSCKGVSWLTPAPAVGDVLVIKGKRGPLRIRLTEVSWVSGVDDMHRFEGAPDVEHDHPQAKDNE